MMGLARARLLMSMDQEREPSGSETDPELTDRTGVGREVSSHSTSSRS